MNPFARHKIEHLSPSSLNTWIDQPSMWAAKYLLGFRDEGPAMWRGLAVEAGLDEFFLSGDRDGAGRRARDWFELKALGLCDDATERERNRVPPMLETAMRATEGFGEPTKRQQKVEFWFDGIEVPVIGLCDYEYPDWGLELKTVSRMPSAITSRHARQVSLYQAAMRKPFKVLYVTDSKHSLYELPASESDLHIKRLQWYAHNIRRVLSVFGEGSEIASLYPPDLDHFYWKGEDARAFANKTWSL
jgi:hypothetical protein